MRAGSKAKASRRSPSAALKRNSFMFAWREPFSVSTRGRPGGGPKRCSMRDSARISFCTSHLYVPIESVHLTASNSSAISTVQFTTRICIYIHMLSTTYQPYFWPSAVLDGPSKNTSVKECHLGPALAAAFDAQGHRGAEDDAPPLDLPTAPIARVARARDEAAVNKFLQPRGAGRQGVEAAPMSMAAASRSRWRTAAGTA